jgi:hypothetical protein
VFAAFCLRHANDLHAALLNECKRTLDTILSTKEELKKKTLIGANSIDATDAVEKLRCRIRGQLMFIAHLYENQLLPQVEEFFFQMNLRECEDDVYNTTQMIGICARRLSDDGRLKFWLEKLAEVKNIYGKRISFVVDDILTKTRLAKRNRRRGKKKSSTRVHPSDTQSSVTLWLRELYANGPPASVEWPTSDDEACERLRLACRALLTMRAQELLPHTHALLCALERVQCKQECLARALRHFEQDVVEHQLHEDMPNWRALVLEPLKNYIITSNARAYNN